MEKSILSAFNKATSQSFHQQKVFIKNVLAGKINHCPKCNQALSIHLTDEAHNSSISCSKKCTDIELDCSK